MLDAHEGFLSTLGKPCVRLNKRIAFPLVAACALFSLYLLSTVFFLDERNLPTLVIPSKDKSPGLRPCFGPDGDVVSANLADTMVIDGPYPRPFAGSYHDLNLPTTWLSFAQRYAPYGYTDERSRSTPGKTPINWTSVDWASLQYSCFAFNAHRFAESTDGSQSLPDDKVRMSYKNQSSVNNLQGVNSGHTGRTALILRTYSGFDYDDEDLLYIRSLIVETTLRSGGRYQVFLLVDVHHNQTDENVFDSPASYERALDAAGVPPEFRSIALLWDDGLLRDWYPLMNEHSTFYQAYQPMQLFALHYPEFDHYWQIEMDMRFLGDAGQFLDTLSHFARHEPRKQALERSTFLHMTPEIGNYESLMRAVDRAAGGGSYAWGPVRIPDIPDPVGPTPPVSDPRQEHFAWGVGEDADLVVTSYCLNATNSPHWVFKDWVYNFQYGNATPRFLCPPAITRTSRTLLLAMHDAQSQKGLMLPSESSPISFALYHGLKVSFPPQPLFWHFESDAETRAAWWKGGPAASIDGVGPRNTSHPSGEGLSFWWTSPWPRLVMDAWRNGVVDDEDQEMPWILRRHNGTMYAPNMLLHPVKHRSVTKSLFDNQNITTRENAT